MTQDQIDAVLSRVRTWPAERQQELAEIALEIKAERDDIPYHATEEELRAIDEGLAGEIATDEEVEAAFARFRAR